MSTSVAMVAEPDGERRLIEAENGLGEEAIAKALGVELRRARERTGLSRAQMVARLPSGIGDRTLLAYEHGLRQLTIVRLVELTEGLGVGATTVLGQALQRAQIHLQNLTLRIDLRALLNDQNHRFRPLHQWARNKLNQCSGGIVEVMPAAVAEIALFLGCDHQDLATYLVRFTPEDAEPQEDSDSTR
jgi:transcriptional regulator with XRE-family HTH domain